MNIGKMKVLVVGALLLFSALPSLSSAVSHEPISDNAAPSIQTENLNKNSTAPNQIGPWEDTSVFQSRMDSLKTNGRIDDKNLTKLKNSPFLSDLDDNIGPSMPSSVSPSKSPIHTQAKGYPVNENYISQKVQKKLQGNMPPALPTFLERGISTTRSVSAPEPSIAVSGTISTDTWWNLTDSPVYVTDNVTVLSGVNLTIEAGVVVYFNASTGLYMDGNLIANGSFGNEIIFTSNQSAPAPGDWKGIQINSTSNSTISVLNYVDIYYANVGLTLSGTSPLVSNSNIMVNNYGIYATQLNLVNNNITLNVNDGIYIDNVTGAFDITGNNISNNGASGININWPGVDSISASWFMNFTGNWVLNNAQDGIYCIFFAYGNTAPAALSASINITGNYMQTNGGDGIYLVPYAYAESFGASITLNLTLVNNNVSYNSGEGILMLSLSYSNGALSAVNTDFIATGNTLYFNQEDGFVTVNYPYQKSDYAYANMTGNASSNTAVGNVWGISLWSYAEQNSGESGYSNMDVQTWNNTLVNNTEDGMEVYSITNANDAPAYSNMTCNILKSEMNINNNSGIDLLASDTGTGHTATLNATVKDSYLYNNTLYGINATNVELVVENNTILENGNATSGGTTTGTTTLFSDDTESGIAGWTATGLWHQVGPGDTYQEYHSPTHSWWYGQDSTGDYDTGSANSGSLRMSASVSIPATATSANLSFYCWYETESSGTTYDQRWVQINDGGGWANLQQLSGEAMDSWHQHTINLSAYIGSTIRIGFYFDTIDSVLNNYRGWYIDDVTITATTAGVISTATGMGIRMVSGTSATLENNIVSDNGLYGIYTDGTSIANWYVDAYGEAHNNDVLMRGNVTILSSGMHSLYNLTMDCWNVNVDGTQEVGNAPHSIISWNVTVNGTQYVNSSTWRMNSTYDGQYHIEVTPTGHMIIQDNGTGPSVITRNQNYAYEFWIQNNGTLEVYDSEVHYCGWQNWTNDSMHTGLWINSDNVWINNSVIADGFNGIVSFQKAPSIQNSTIINNFFAGIYTLNGSVSRIAYNTIEWNGGAYQSIGWANYTWGYGVYVNNSSDNILFNNILHNGPNGTANGGEFLVYALGYGVYMNESMPYLEGNNLMYSGGTASGPIAIGYGYGIYAMDSDFTAYNNPQIDHNGASSTSTWGWYAAGYGRGAYLYNTTANLTDNSLSLNSGEGSDYSEGIGVRCIEGSAEIWNNAIDGNGMNDYYGWGVYYWDSTITLGQNTIDQNGMNAYYYGFGAVSSYSTTTMSQNAINQNGMNAGAGAGIYAWSSTGEITGNSISSNNFVGTYLENCTGVSITGNSISQQSYGIYIIKSRNHWTISDNYVLRNSNTGIYIYGELDADMGNNAVQGNGDGIFLNSNSGRTAGIRYSGAYNLTYLAFSFETINGQATRDQLMNNIMNWFGHPGTVLLVDDDEGENYEAYYNTSLSASGYGPGNRYYWDTSTQGTPPASVLEENGTVIWFTGYAWSNTLNSSERTSIQQFLSNGGNLFLTGQKIGYDAYSNIWSNWYNTWLKADYITYDSGVYNIEGLGDPVSDSLNLNIRSYNGDGADYYEAPEVIKAINGAQESFVYQHSNEVNIYQNNVTGNTNKGLRIEYANPYVHNNVNFSNNGQDGIYWHAVDIDARIHDNRVYNNGQDGIYFRAERDLSVLNSDIYSNEITYNGGDGIYAGANANISIVLNGDNNIINYNTNNGIESWAGGHTTVNLHQTLLYNGQDGINSYSTDYLSGTISASDISWNGNNGITLSSGNYADIGLYSNTIDYNGGWGAHITGSNYVAIDASSNDLSYNNNGIYLQSSGYVWGSMVNDVITFNTVNGAEIYNSDRLTLTGETVSDNGNNGLYLSAGENTWISQSSFERNGNEGIFMENCQTGTVELYSSTVNLNGNNGIHLRNSNPWIHDNEIANNGNSYTNFTRDNGIYIQLSNGPSIKSNDIHDNVNNGISMYQSSDVLGESNQIYGNYLGIYSNASSSRLGNNTITYNLGSSSRQEGGGIWAVSSSDVRIYNNIISYNLMYGIYSDGTSLTNWFVDATARAESNTLLLRGNIEVRSGGTLTLKDIDGAYPNGMDLAAYIRAERNNQFHIQVDAGAQMNVENTKISSYSTDSYEFVVNGRLQMNGGIVEMAYRLEIHSDNVKIVGSTIRNGWYGGIAVYNSNPTIRRSSILNNTYYGLYLNHSIPTLDELNIQGNREGIALDGTTMTFTNIDLNNNNIGIKAYANSHFRMYNSTLSNYANDFYLMENSSGWLLNTHFNKTRTTVLDTSILDVNWFCHVMVMDMHGNPIVGANVTVYDRDGTVAGNKITDSAGYARWFVTREYVENDNGKVYYTPHNIMAEVDGVVRYVIENMDDTKTVVITSNNMPHITSTPVTNATEDMEYYYNVEAYDPNGDTLTYALVERPPGMTINPSTGEITWTPTNAQVGIYNVTIRAEDGNGGYAIQSWEITVANVNNPPEIMSTPITTATQDALYQYNVTARDIDGDTLIYSLDVSPAGMSINASTGLIIWTPTNAQVGEHTVTVKVDDGNGGYDTQTFIVTVQNVNDPPVITSTPATNATEDSLYYYQIIAEDPDNNALTYILTSQPSGMSIDRSSGLITWVPKNSDVGTHRVSVVVLDGHGGMAEQNFNLTVANVNDAPVLYGSTVSPTAGNSDEKYIFTVTYMDEDGNAPAGVYVIIDGSRKEMKKVSGDDYTKGVVYEYKGNLAAGPHSYSFEAEDGNGGNTMTLGNALDVQQPESHLWTYLIALLLLILIILVILDIYFWKYRKTGAKKAERKVKKEKSAEKPVAEEKVEMPPEELEPQEYSLEEEDLGELDEI